MIYRQIWQLSVKNIHGLYMHPLIYKEIRNYYFGDLSSNLSFYIKVKL